MNPLRFAVALFLSSLAVASPSLVYEYSFQPGPLPEGWTAARGKVAVDAAVTHEGKPSLRVEASDEYAQVQSAPVTLAIGKRYEIRAWVRTENLVVRDTDRTPIAAGANVAMASMPLDVHSESLGGTRNWRRLSLKFTATRSQDRIVLSAGNGGAATGRTWFAGVSLEEVSSRDQWPSRAAVKTFGPAYRYPTGGWIYLHIEGEPYERGYQHGYLMAHEISQYIDRCAAELDSKSRNHAWSNGRAMADALFLRGFDKEILQEMKGIADGAAAAGAKYDGRAVDLNDIVAANTITELGLLHAATRMTPSGLEGLHMQRPDYFDPKRDVPVGERCSAFCATGPATKDGKMVIAHLTMWSLTLAEQTNVMLDVKPVSGHRVLMQSYPGGIQSGTDWYQNDAGMVLTETTIRQSPFNINGTPVAHRARKAIQYGDNVDGVVEHLRERNNGLYTNEWMIGDAKNNEIAMLELGTYKTRLYRSSQNDWFGNTPGFYWGCNNAKALDVRLEYAPDPQGAPAHIPYTPADRDLKWQQLYQEHKGSIDEQFAFLAMRTAPLVSSTSMDGKVATSDMASHLMVWAVFGKPNQREWLPSPWQKANYEGSNGIHSSGYRMIQAEPHEGLREAVKAAEESRLKATKAEAKKDGPKAASFKDKVWKGWILPAGDGDLWLSEGSAAYYRALKADDLEKDLEAQRVAYRSAALEGDRPLSQLVTDTRSMVWSRLAGNKGSLLLDALRREMGDAKFFPAMESFFAANTTRKVTTAEFRAAMAKASEKPLDSLFTAWLDQTGLPGDTGGSAYLTASLRGRLANTVLVYGTVMDAGSNRHAAEEVQKRLLDAYESAVPVRKDFEVGDEELRDRDVIFVGRPESNSALNAWRERLGLDYNEAVFRVGGVEYASEGDALVLAAANPLSPKRMVLVLAGNSALETVRLAAVHAGAYSWAVYHDGAEKKTGFKP